MKWLKKVAATPLTSIARVIDSLQNQTNDRTNAPSIHAVREAIKDNWLTIYPVGSIYMSVNDVNPATIFGGTWQRIKDKFLLASGDTYENGATGGEATHMLNASEIPTHNHSYTKAVSVDEHALTELEMPPHSHGRAAQYLGSTTTVSLAETTTPPYTELSYNEPLLTVGGGEAHSHGLTTTTDNTGNSGGNTAHNNMPPYLAVNVWVRTA